MYALLLAFRYLRTRLIPLVAIGAVGLCAVSYTHLTLPTIVDV